MATYSSSLASNKRCMSASILVLETKSAFFSQFLDVIAPPSASTDDEREAEDLRLGAAEVLEEAELQEC